MATRLLLLADTHVPKRARDLPAAVWQAVEDADVVIHAGETLADGRRASTEPRVGVFHQARFSGIAGRQVTGRTHRDHQVSPWHIAYAEGTVEEQVGKVMVERIAAASDTVGGDTTGLADLATLLGADWLPITTLTEDGA
jgi:predicted phosphodiesterase